MNAEAATGTTLQAAPGDTPDRDTPNSDTPNHDTFARRGGLGGAWAFFAFEMRRHLPAVGLLVAAVLAFDLLIGWLASSQGFHAGDDARVALAVPVLSLFTVVLSLQLLLTSWLRERADGSLAWLYARPMAAGTLFAVRLAAALAALVLFVAGGLLVLRVPPAALLDPALLETGTPRLVGLALLGFLAAALFTSAVAWSAGAGLLLALLLAGLGLVVAQLPSLAAPAPAHLLADPGWPETVRTLLLAIGLPAAFLVGAWVATRRAVLDRGQSWRGATAAAGMAAVAVAVATVAVYAGTHTAPAEPLAALPLAAGTELRFARDADLREGIAALSVVDAGGERRLDGLYGGWPPFVHRASGRVMLPLASGEWLLFDEQARVRRRFTAHRSRVRDAAGWSPDGSRFAMPCTGVGLEWMTRLPTAGAWLPDAESLAASACPNDRGVEALLLVGVDGDRLVPLPPGTPADAWRAAWADDDHLVVAVDPHDGEPGRWLMVDVASRMPRVANGPHALVEGHRLLLPPPAAAAADLEIALYNLGAVQRGLPRRDGRLLAWLVGPRAVDLVAVAPAAAGDGADGDDTDTDTGTGTGTEGGGDRAAVGGDWHLRTVAHLPGSSLGRSPWPRAGGLATLADGTAVWVEGRLSGPHTVYLLPPGAAAPEVACELPAHGVPAAFAGVWRGDGARRVEWLPAFAFGPERPPANLSCELASGA